MSGPSLEGVNCSQEDDMETARPAGIFIALFVSILVTFFLSFLPLILSGFKAAEDKARARRLADARMNARLLRLNI
jgi:hypothetical protein